MRLSSLLVGIGHLTHRLDLAIHQNANLDEALVDVARLATVAQPEALRHIGALFQPPLDGVEGLQILVWFSHRSLPFLECCCAPSLKRTTMCFASAAFAEAPRRWRALFSRPCKKKTKKKKKSDLPRRL